MLEILHLLDSAQFDELELQTEHFHLVLRRTEEGDWTRSTEVTAEPRVGRLEDAKADAATAAALTVSEAPDGSAAAVGEGMGQVRAPLPGAFYRSPQPGAPPFVETGSRVDEDTVVGIIETMKLMTSVHAGVRGTVDAIVLEDSGFVEKGGLLMRIVPDSG